MYEPTPPISHSSSVFVKHHALAISRSSFIQKESLFNCGAAAIQCFQLHIQSTLSRYFSPLRGSGSPSWIRSHYPGLGEVDHLLSIKLWEKE